MMTIVKVSSKNYGDGVVDVANWADPNIIMLDFVDKIGDTWPVYKKDLEYIGVEVKANSQNEALEKALEKYHQGSFDEEYIQDPDWSNAELDIDEESKINKLDNGVYIREIKQ